LQPLSFSGELLVMAPKRSQTPATGNFHDIGADSSLPSGLPPLLVKSWTPTVVGDDDLQLLVNQGILPPKETGLWETQKVCLYPGRTSFNTPVFDWYFI